MINAYTIGVSTMGVAQRAMDIIGQNIANAATPGYHRQTLSLTSTTVGDKIGTGVEVSGIVRQSVPGLRSSIVSAASDVARSTSQLDTQRQAESVFSTGSGSIDGRLQSLFNTLDSISTAPTDATQKRVAVDAASTLAGTFNQVASDITKLQADQLAGAQAAVAQINTLAPKIADLNDRISIAEAGGTTASDLRDQRDMAITELSTYLDLRVSTQDNQGVNIIGANTAVVVGRLPNQFEVFTDLAGQLAFRQVGTTNAVRPQSGKMAGFLQDFNQTLPGYRARLDTLANKLISAVNAVQSTGLSSAGPATTLSGTVSVGDPNALLNTQTLTSPVQAGQLYISVTQTSTGTRSLVPVSIDPATQSLTDVANAITGATGGQVQGSVDPASNTLLLQAQTGFTFDFTGRLPTPPDNLVMNGTSTPSVTGAYTGSSNDSYLFQVTGTGTIGTTPGLNVEVRNSANTLLATLNIGQGYLAGSPINLPNGLVVKFGAGDTNNGSFSVPVISNADSAGLLPAIGAGGLFKGSDASSIAVNQAFLDDPTRLATSRTGNPGETSNIVRMASIQDQRLFGNGSQTLSQYYGDLIGQVGQNVNNLSDLQTTQTNLSNNLNAQEQSKVGVDLNEEMVNLLTYQRMVESGSKYLSVVNRALDAVIAIVN